MMFGGFLIAAIIVNYFIGDPPLPHFANAREKASYYYETQNFTKAEHLYGSLLQTDSDDLDLHYAFISSHYAAEKNDRAGDSSLKTN